MTRPGFMLADATDDIDAYGPNSYDSFEIMEDTIEYDVFIEEIKNDLRRSGELVD